MGSQDWSISHKNPMMQQLLIMPVNAIHKSTKSKDPKNHVMDEADAPGEKTSR